MITKKKIIAYVMSFLTVISVSGNAFAFLEDIDDVPEKDIMAAESTAGEFSGDDVFDSYKLLNYIDCITEPAESFEENETVTKAYAAYALAAVASGYRADSAVLDVFSDVSETHEYASGIAAAFEAGIIDGAEKFYPNKNVSVNELSDMALRALKYNYVYFGNSPFSKAKDLGFFKGVEYSDDSITKGQFMIFLRNVLDTDYIKINGIDAYGNADIEIVDGVSQLEKYFDIYKQDGIVTGYKYSSINADADFNEGEVLINRGIFKINYDLSMDYVGAYVDAYVDEENGSLIVSLSYNKKKTNTHTINKESFVEYSESSMTYYNGSKNVRVSISDSALVMYNNTYYGLYRRIDDNDFFYNCDRIYLIDNDSDNKADIVKVEKYTYYIIKTVSVDTQTINFDKNGGTLVIDDNSWVDFTFNGETIELKDLKLSDVLTVLETVRKDNSRIFSAVVTKDVNEGVIKQIGYDDLGKYYEIEGERYYLCDEYNELLQTSASEKKPKTGDFVRLYISFDKKVVASMSEDDFLYGYIMSGTSSEEEEVVKFTIYNISGESNSYFFADKVKVYTENYPEGIRKEKFEAIKIYLDGDEKIKNDAVAYSLNSEGEIISIVKPYDRRKEKHGSIYYPLTYDYSGENLVDSDAFLARIYREVFASKYKIASSVPILVIPGEEELRKNEKAYGIKSSTSWGAEGKKVHNTNFKIYNCDKFYIPQFCTMEGTIEKSISQGIYGETYMYCIDKVIQTIDEEDMPVTQISYYHNGKLTNSPLSSDVTFVNPGLYCDVDSVEELKKGDIVQISKDTLGNITLISVLFSIQKRPEEFGAYFTKNTKTDENGIKRIVPQESILDKDAQTLLLIYGKVEDVNNDVVLVNTSKTGKNEEHTYPVVIGNSVYKAVNYSIYNTQTKTVSAASLSEIQPNDTVVMRKYYNHIQDVIIIR